MLEPISVKMKAETRRNKQSNWHVNVASEKTKTSTFILKRKKEFETQKGRQLKSNVFSYVYYWETKGNS